VPTCDSFCINTFIPLDKNEIFSGTLVIMHGAVREGHTLDSNLEFLCLFIKVMFVCKKVVIFWKMNFKKVNYFSIFSSVMENKLENTFQCLVMSWKMSWKITY